MYGRIGYRTLGAVLAGVLLAGLGVGVSSGLVTDSSHPQPGPTVAVTPNTNLVDLQSVTVTGSGFSANATLGSVECIPTAVDPSSCDLSTLVYTNADNGGAFFLSRQVRRLIFVNGATVDCAAPSSCILGVGNVNDFTESSGASISFDPSVPPVVPHVRVTPATGLRDHQLVTVTGEGFAPGSFVSVTECLAENAFECAYETNRNAQVTDGGRFTIRNFALEREFFAFGNDGPVTVDCAVTPHTCVLEVDSGGFGGGGSATAPLAFDPAVPPAVPAITVFPARGLADLQLVTVHGTGFLPGAIVSLSQCASETFSCDPGAVNVTAGFRGQFTVSMAVRRRLAGVGFGVVVQTDCAGHVGACSITAMAPGTLLSPSATLGFDPTKPAVASTIVVQPNTGLFDNQIVNVKLGGFARYRQVAVVECSSDAIARQDLSFCDGSTAAVTTTPGGGGDMSVSLFVRRTIAGRDGLVDCGAKPGACVLVASPLSFFGYIGGGGTPVPARPAAANRPQAVSRALPAPPTNASTRPLAAAKDGTLPGIAFAPLGFHG